MPPRRSITRNSLPTPANSVKRDEESTSPTSSTPVLKGSKNSTGLYTPASLTDGEADELPSDEEEVDAELSGVRNTKRKGS